MPKATRPVLLIKLLGALPLTCEVIMFGLGPALIGLGVVFGGIAALVIGAHVVATRGRRPW